MSTIANSTAILNLIQLKYPASNPAAPNKIAVYIGCRINRYGPLVTSTAAAAGTGEMRNLLCCITAIAHITSSTDAASNTVEATETANGAVVNNSTPISVN